MSYSLPPSRKGSIFRRQSNVAQVDLILDENAKLRAANAYCKSETERARMALSVTTWELKNVQNENHELKRQIQEINEALRRTRESELAGVERYNQLQRTLDQKNEQMAETQTEMVELKAKHDKIVDEKETVVSTFQGMKKDLVQAFECAICAQILYRPWSVIDCGHSFCEYCILAVLSNYTSTDHNSGRKLCLKAVLVIPGTVRPTGNLLKILESYAQELEMALDEATKGEMDAEYAAKHSTPRYFRYWLEMESERVRRGLRSYMSWSE